MRKVRWMKAIKTRCRWPKIFGRCSSNLRCCKGAKGDHDHDHDQGQTDKNRHVDLATGRVQLIKTVSEWEAKLEEAKMPDKIMILNFSSSWSGPCRSIAPPYCKLADKYPSITFVTVDADALAEMSSTWEVKATPTFFFLREGKLVDKHVGADKVELKTKIANIDSLSS
ncbi:Thioredoxin H-type [Linum grandiflorum]